MSYHFYLKKVVAFIEAKGYESEFDRLREKLELEGIQMECYYRETGEAADEKRSHTGEAVKEALCGDRRTEETAQGVPGRENSPVEAEEVNEGVLWILDNGNLAEKFVAAHIPLLVFMHPGNREQDFFRAQYGCEYPGEMDPEYLDKIYRRFAGHPWDILETKRCLIRETIPDDVNAFYQIYGEPSITEHMDGLYPDPEQEREYIREYIEKVYSFYQFGIWTVICKESGEVIGRAGLNYRENYDDPELGFIIGVPWQGQGFAAEVCGEVLKYGWEELDFDRVQALVEPDNHKSLNVCKKLGMWALDHVEENGKEFIRLVVDNVKYKISPS